MIIELWMDNGAEEAAQFYVNAFGNSEMGKITHYTTETPSNKPIGSVLTVDFTLRGQRFQAMNGGEAFKPNPSISCFVNFDPSRDEEASAHLDELWGKLSEGGTALMALGEYPFSKKYGWIQDRFGVSWQLILTDPKGEPRPDIIPSLLFVGKVSGRAEEALSLYVSVFKDSHMGTLARYPGGMEPDKEGTVMFGEAKLGDQWIAAMDSAHKHEFAFSEGVSFVVECEDQAEVDYYWDAFTSNGGEESVCGWCKDKFGVSWQIVPKGLEKLLSDPDPLKAKRAMDALLTMRKLDLSALERAAEGK